MSFAGLAADKITDKAVEAAGWMLVPAYPFLPTKALGLLMPIGKGAPGTLAEGGRSWLDGANELQGAIDELKSLVEGLTPDDWSGTDRQAFDQSIAEWMTQLSIGQQYANAAGMTLAAQSLALAPYGGFCLAIGGVMMAEGIAFDAAVASGVGNLGVSEAIYAEANAVGFGMLAGLASYVGVISMMMSTSALLFQLGALNDAKGQQQHGDTNALDTLKHAEVKGLAEVGKNLEGFAAGVAGDLAASKLGGRAGVPEVGIAGHAINTGIETLIGKGITQSHEAVVDGVTGEGPGRVLTDLTGLSGTMDDVDRIFDDGVPDDVDAPDDVEYSLPAPPPPPPPPVIPLPTAPPGGPDVVPIPNAGPDDGEVIPASSSINETEPA